MEDINALDGHSGIKVSERCNIVLDDFNKFVELLSICEEHISTLKTRVNDILDFNFCEIILLTFKKLFEDSVCFFLVLFFKLISVSS